MRYRLASDDVSCRARQGRSLGELLVVLSLVAIVVAVLLPRIQASRESSRRVRCQLRLKRVGEALAAYHLLHRYYPAGVVTDDVPVCNDDVGFDHNWISGLLPQLGQTEWDRQLDRSQSVYADRNHEWQTTAFPEMRCPSMRSTQLNLTSYAGNAASIEVEIDRQNDGVFFVDSFLSEEQILDGLDHTVFVAEKLPLSDDRGWLSGTRASLRNGGHSINAVSGTASENACFVGGFASNHVGGAYLMMGSGRLSFFSESIDIKMLTQLTSRSDLDK